MMKKYCLVSLVLLVGLTLCACKEEKPEIPEDVWDSFYETYGSSETADPIYQQNYRLVQDYLSEQGSEYQWDPERAADEVADLLFYYQQMQQFKEYDTVYIESAEIVRLERVKPESDGFVLGVTTDDGENYEIWFYYGWMRKVIRTSDRMVLFRYCKYS